MTKINKKFSSQKKLYIESILLILPFTGWNDELLVEASKACGFGDGYESILFPDRVNEIIDFFEEDQDERMLEILIKTTSLSKIREKIGEALKIRIKNISKLVQIKNAAYFAMPNNVALATKLGWRTCDVIWRYAGDQSLDHNYYTKRGLLFSVYIASIMYYIQDESENQIDMDLFIEKSLSNIIAQFSNIANLGKILDPSNIPIIRLFS